MYYVARSDDKKDTQYRVPSWRERMRRGNLLFILYMRKVMLGKVILTVSYADLFSFIDIFSMFYTQNKNGYYIFSDCTNNTIITNSIFT